MKTKLSIVFAAAFGFFAQAQDCVETLNIMGTAYKTKDPAAYEYLEQLRKDCPDVHKALYAYGEAIIKRKISEVGDNATEKEKNVRDLIKLYDEYAANFPDYGKAGIDMNKGLALFNYKVGTNEEVYTYFDKAFNTDLANFDNPVGLYAYFEIFVNDYKAGNKGIDLQQVFDKYDDIQERLAQLAKENSESLDSFLQRQENGEELSSKETRAKEKNESNLENIATVTSSMDGIIIELSTCEKLIPFYQKSFEENKTNEVWLKRASDRLEAKGCDDDPLFSKMSEALYKLNPSANAAYKLGIVEKQKGNTSKAIEYFNQAANLYQDNTKKAAVYMRLASMYKSSNRSQARTYAKKALEVKPSYGTAYLFIADLYAKSMNECGSTPFEKRAIYWLCARYANKAASVDPSIKSAAAKAAASYNDAAPSRTEIFQANMQGKQICFKCWVGECITVPNL